MFTHVNYTLETRRYGFVFNTTFIKELPAQPWYNTTITCPTYTMSVEVLDSKGELLSNVQVNLMEWSSWNSVDSGTTDNQGNVNLSATFGRYKVKVYNDSAVLGREVVLNETMFDLIDPGLSVVVHSKIFNIDLSVKALDYFGQTVPNAMVEIERKVGQEWVEVDSSTTGLDGLASLNSIVGGDYRISIYLAGKLAGIKQLYLDESKQILFKIDTYAVIGGYPVETIQLITYVSIVLLVVAFSLALTYRRLLRRFLKKKAESEK
jgi:5-hydroxyisourate hydrolase-like protein (transthyretin family)